MFQTPVCYATFCGLTPTKMSKAGFLSTNSLDDGANEVLGCLLQAADYLARFLTKTEVHELIVRCFSLRLMDFGLVQVLRAGANECPELTVAICAQLESNIAEVFKRAREPGYYHRCENWAAALIGLYNVVGSNFRDLQLAQRAAAVDGLLTWTIDSMVKSLSIAREQQLGVEALKLTTCVLLKLPTIENGSRFLARFCCEILNCPFSFEDGLCEEMFNDKSNGIRVMEKLLEAILTILSGARHLTVLLGRSGAQIGSTSHSYFRKVLLQADVGPGTTKLLVSYFVTNMDVAALERFIEDVARLWSDQNIVSSSSWPYLLHISRVLLLLGDRSSNSRCGELLVKSWPRIMSGVQFYLRRPEDTVKQLGMLVGQQLSTLLESTAGALDFELKPLPEIAKLLAEISDGSTSGPDTSHASESEPVLRMVEVRPASKLDSDDEELDFEPYEMPSNELFLDNGKESTDVAKISAPPRYLRECISWLTEDDLPRWESAFNALEGFIIRKAIGLQEESGRLLRILIYLDDKSGIQDFEKMKQSRISNLLAVYPHLVPLAAESLFAARGTMNLRYELLHCIHDAAKILSDGSGIDDASDAQPAMGEMPARPKWRSVVDQRVQDRTRYITQRLLGKKKTKLRSNRLSASIDLFTYPLLRSEVSGEHLQLLGQDYQLFSCILSTVCEIVEMATMAPTLHRICGLLNEAADSIARRPEPLLRLTVFFVRGTVLDALPEELFLQLFQDRLKDWLEFAGEHIDDRGSDQDLPTGSTGIMKV
ncbi:unnamed protein product, partial [Mesorhabditis spiculigera]